MREIKFRAWNKDDNEILSWNDLLEQGYELHELDSNGKYAHIFMQYTGLKDKNGKEIYEGDVVEVDSFYESIPHYPTDNETDNLIGIVKYINGAFEADSVPLYVLYETGQPEIEVIGNIHENPELL